MACTRSKRSSDEAPSPPMCSAFTTIEKAQCNFSTDSRGLSPVLGGVQVLRMQVADSTTTQRAEELLSSLGSIRFTESGSEAVEATMTHPRRVNTAQQLAQFPWGSCKCTYGHKSAMTMVSKFRQLNHMRSFQISYRRNAKKNLRQTSLNFSLQQSSPNPNQPTLLGIQFIGLAENPSRRRSQKLRYHPRSSPPIICIRRCREQTPIQLQQT